MLVIIILIITFNNSIFTKSEETKNELVQERDEMLRWAFETSFVNSYTKLDDLPEDCNYPCYKYQGKWKLKNEYKMPFFRERSGFHYQAVEVNMYVRCMSEKSISGNLFEGYEYQKHEIWYDKRELPIDSFMNEDASLKDFYITMDLNKEADFVKVATVHTFFRNEFEIDSIYIKRNGKVIGRDLEFESDETLQGLLSEDIKNDIAGELNRIATNRLQDFSRPISCENALAPAQDFHMIKEGDEMSFDCQLTTSRVPMNYTKTYILTDQFIKNICR